MPTNKHFFFYACATSLTSIFLAIYPFIKPIPVENKGIKLIFLHIWDITENISYGAMILFTDGYLIDLLNKNNGKNLGYLMI
jgi:hypothetical protein